MSRPSRPGVPLVVSAPSGGGKTTLCRRLMAELPGVEFSVSHTTRPLRGSEKDGVDYHFVDEDTFERLATNGAFLEWAHVHGRRYGTSRAETEQRLAAGVDVLFDIDIQGGRQIAKRVVDAVLVFVVPPDMKTLEARLRGRASDPEEQVSRRLQAARREIEAATFYPYWIVNDHLGDALARLRAVLEAERQKRVNKAELAQSVLAGS